MLLEKVELILGKTVCIQVQDLTNSSAIVSGDVARSAANAIVNGVTSRLMTALQQNEDTAAHMSYTSNGYGIGMAANRLLGGLSLWTNYTDSNLTMIKLLPENLLIQITMMVILMPYLLELIKDLETYCWSSRNKF